MVAVIPRPAHTVRIVFADDPRALAGVTSRLSYGASGAAGPGFI